MPDNDVIIGLATSPASNDVIMGLALLYFGLANDAGISGEKSLLSGYVWKSRERAEYQVKNHFCLGDSRQNDPDRDPPI
jgi:hypothetical protein